MEIEKSKLPVHIGIIMDGNGRWAKKHSLPRKAGHREGGKRVEDTLSFAYDLGVKVLSLYAFSSENWNRPKDEVDSIFSLIKSFLKGSVKKLTDKGVKLIVTGDRNGLPDDLVKLINSSEKSTENNSLGVLNIAVNYGGRQDLVQAFNKLKRSGKEIITEKDISENLSTASLPPLDLIIRTGGEKRLSNFMLYEASYSELYFTDTLFPDFKKEQLLAALKDYGSRKRNFGGITENA